MIKFNQCFGKKNHNPREVDLVSEKRENLAPSLNERTEDRDNSLEFKWRLEDTFRSLEFLSRQMNDPELRWNWSVFITDLRAKIDQLKPHAEAIEDLAGGKFEEANRFHSAMNRMTTGE